MSIHESRTCGPFLGLILIYNTCAVKQVRRERKMEAMLGKLRKHYHPGVYPRITISPGHVIHF